ncbi:hypothetical protein Tco_0560021 [Tanacetum coccineum]
MHNGADHSFLRYIDTRPNGDALRKCILEDEIYSTVDACLTAHEMWEAIERLQQVNVQFLPQLQPEWLRFVTIVKQQHKLDEVSYHKFFDILKQYQKHKCKEIAKPITPPSESASKEDSDPEQAQKDKEMQKNLALIANDSGTPSSEPLEHVQYDTGYNMFADEIQHFEQSESISNTCVVETGDRNVISDSPDMCDNDIQNDQNDVECDDERVVLANLIANLKLDVDENKMIQNQLKKANTILAHELTECKSILAETSRTLEEHNSKSDS